MESEIFMWLERFNHYGEFIDFDPSQMAWREASSTEGAKAVGVGDLHGDAVVAMVGLSGALYLYIGRDKISLQDPGLKLTYEHKDDGTTTFSAADANHSATITYNSWWVGSGAGIAAFGSSSDEDEDVCAYIEFMMGAGSEKACDCKVRVALKLSQKAVVGCVAREKPKSVVVAAAQRLPQCNQEGRIELMGIDIGPRFNTEDVYIDYPFEEVIFRWEHAGRKIYRKFYDKAESGPIPHDNRLYNEALLYGDETTRDAYLAGKSSSPQKRNS